MAPEVVSDGACAQVINATEHARVCSEAERWGLTWALKNGESGLPPRQLPQAGL